MSRNVTSLFRSAAFAQETDQVYLVLLEMDGPDFGDPILIVNNYADVVSNGNTYIGFPFDVELPQDFEDAIPSVRLTVCNVDRQIVDFVRTLTAPPTVSISVVLASSPSTVEAGPYTMTLREASYDATAVSFMLTPEDMLNESYPGDHFTPESFPGIF